MIKKNLYPKTKRVGQDTVFITEKLDGLNLGLFKLDGKLIVAQRNVVFIYPYIDKGAAISGLIDWLDAHADNLLDTLHEGSGFFGEWISSGHIDYSKRFDRRFYIFAKAKINENLEISKLNYDLELLKYASIDEKIPLYIGVVPFVYGGKRLELHELDDLYEGYCKYTNSKVEGFVINDDNNITKYVRYKRGKLTPHELENNNG